MSNKLITDTETPVPLLPPGPDLQNILQFIITLSKSSSTHYSDLQLTSLRNIVSDYDMHIRPISNVLNNQFLSACLIQHFQIILFILTLLRRFQANSIKWREKAKTRLKVDSIPHSTTKLTVILILQYWPDHSAMVWPSMSSIANCNHNQHTLQYKSTHKAKANGNPYW